MHSSMFILDFFFLTFSYCCKYVYLDRDIDIYWYYNDNSNNRNDDSKGGDGCDNRNRLVAACQTPEV